MTKYTSKFLQLSIFIFALFFSNLAFSATYTVTNTNDSGIGSLRQAILDADDDGVDDTITFDQSLAYSTITLSSELPIGLTTNSLDDLTISGPITANARGITIDADSNSRIFNISSGSLTSSTSIILENMTLTGGMVGTTSSNEKGGAIYSHKVALKIKNTVISGNSCNAFGGGIFHWYGSLNIENSTINNNTGGSAGSGVYVLSGDLTILNSTVSDNLGASNGAINISYGNLILKQSTISGNISSSSAGIYAYNANVTINQSTITNNTNNTTYALNSGSGLYHFTSNGTDYTIHIENSVLSNNNNGITYGGNYLSKTHANGTGVVILNVSNSIFGDDTDDYVAEITGTATAVIYNTNPDLGPLQFNGGKTQTHKPNVGSPVINVGNNTDASEFSNDQRDTSFQRIKDVTVDIGAVEFQNISGNTVIPLPIGEVMTRRDMARVMIRAKHGSSYSPPPATGLVYDDVKIGDINADWIEQFEAEGLTEGCALNRFCPDSVVSREAMAKTAFIGMIGTNPSPNVVNFIDTGGQNGFNSLWINAAFENGGITLGCTIDKYCPKEPVTREWVDGDLLDEF